ncbi:hypothetical protein [Tunturiibacter gelidoferens]|uniref:Uncharacterized protein n=1 Tax=Tunturiibacter lichenicola TaxID=2051959 RepID=A0A7Y9NJV9_9BACT|nr:hypothetical protein [Edaphobacter lichenicola]NYF50721.1 hypothetical protein [Edaphobacter lichenicola]
MREQLAEMLVMDRRISIFTKSGGSCWAYNIFFVRGFVVFVGVFEKNGSQDVVF